MKRTKILLPLTTLIIAPTLGAQVVACAPSKTKEEPMVKQNIYIEPSDFPEVVVKSTTEMFDPANPRIVIDVDSEYADDYEIAGIDGIWCGPTQLIKYDENQDYIFERPDVDSTSMAITFLYPEKITKALYIKPTVESIARHTVSLDPEEGQEEDFKIVGTECKHEHSFKSDISFTENVPDQWTRRIVVTTIKIFSEAGSSRFLVLGEDYTVTTYAGPETCTISVQFNSKVIDGDVSISCKHINRGPISLSTYIGEKPVHTEENCIGEGEQTIKLNNPLFDLGFDSPENQTHKISVEAFNGDDPIPSEDIEYDPNNTESITVTFIGVESKDIKVVVHPLCKATPKECFENDEWSKVLAMILWSNEDPNVFCRFYDTDLETPTKMNDFLGATKHLTWNSNDYPVMVVATNYYHYALEHDDDKIHVRDDTCSKKVTLFTFKFMQALSKTNGDVVNTNWNEEMTFEHSNNMNNWYCYHDSGVFDHDLEYYSCVPRDILNDQQSIEGKKFTKHFSDQQFVKAVKYVANYTRVSNCETETTEDHQYSYIRDLFFLPTAVQLGMRVYDATQQMFVPYSEPENKKPAFDFYKQEEYKRWRYDDTSAKPQLAVTNKKNKNVSYYVATAHSNSSNDGPEYISSIEVPTSELGWRLGYHQIDGTKQALTPCFCL